MSNKKLRQICRCKQGFETICAAGVSITRSQLIGRLCKAFSRTQTHTHARTRALTLLLLTLDLLPRRVQTTATPWTSAWASAALCWESPARSWRRVWSTPSDWPSARTAWLPSPPRRRSVYSGLVWSDLGWRTGFIFLVVSLGGRCWCEAPTSLWCLWSVCPARSSPCTRSATTPTSTWGGAAATAWALREG